MTTEYMRAFVEGTPSKSGPLTFVAGSEGMKIDGRDYRMAGMDLARYQANPVVMWCHDLKLPPIGRGEASIDGPRLLLDVEFDTADPFAAEIDGKYRRGFLNAVSMTALPTDGNGGPGPRRGVVEHSELIEVSAVPVPLDPDSLRLPSLRSLQYVGRDLRRAAGRELSANDKRERLAAALTDRFGGTDVWVWVRDFGDTWVVYELEDPDGLTTWRLGYTVGANDEITLGQTPERVEVRTTYETADTRGLVALRDALAGQQAVSDLRAVRSALVAQESSLEARLAATVRRELDRELGRRAPRRSRP